MDAPWQDKVALSIVLITAGLFLGRFVWGLIRPKNSGCQAGCGCSLPKQGVTKLRSNRPIAD